MKFPILTMFFLAPPDFSQVVDAQCKGRNSTSFSTELTSEVAAFTHRLASFVAREVDLGKYLVYVYMYMVMGIGCI